LVFLKGSISLFNIKLFDHSKDVQKISKLLKEVVCYNQGELAQYTYLAGEKHKEMKMEILKESPNKENLKVFKEELEKHLNVEFEKVVKKNFEYIKEYFSKRSKMEPRVCIKVSEDSKVIDLFREEDQLYIAEYEIQENKGFSYVHETGKYYFCNNIPSELKARRYYNPRLDEHEALKYKQSKLSWLYQKIGREDTKWIDCWGKININQKEETPLAKQCYKSTIITPMTLLGNTLSREFMEQFKITSLPERAIYGFLCLDHHYTGYFKEDTDVPISYIFADLLSLYLITNLTYTEYSKTYKKVETFLSCKEL